MALSVGIASTSHGPRAADDHRTRQRGNQLPTADILVELPHPRQKFTRGEDGYRETSGRDGLCLEMLSVQSNEKAGFGFKSSRQDVSILGNDEILARPCFRLG